MSQPVIAPATIDKEFLALWAKYEDIAMHFNDLLLRLRSQGLAGIAAISTLVGIFTKEAATSIQFDWLIATAIFIALAVFWIAIWCLDLLYYNRLLQGAVAALVDLEAKSGAHFANFDGINMSTRIVQEFKLRSGGDRFSGILMFYTLVFATIISGAIFSWHMHYLVTTVPLSK